MNLTAILRLAGILLMVFSLAMVVSDLVALWYGDGSSFAFLFSFLITFGSGFLLWSATRRSRRELSTRDGFLVVALFWIMLGLFGALPLYLSTHLDISFTDAAFESISGITTTGSTVLTGLDDLPHGILFYRQFLQWLGGVGVIVIALAILPILGVGGMQMYRAETPGHVKDNKLAPRINNSAKILFGIYVTLTAACAISYWLAGMTPFDAIVHAFSTISTGGYSTYDASMGHFQSPVILLICSAFMLLGATSFAVHFLVWRSGKLLPYWRDPETRFFLSVVLLSAGVMAVYLTWTRTYSFPDALVFGIFQTATAITSSGFGAEDFASWPTFLPTLVLFIALMGGCAGSTTGGIKAMRIMLILKQGLRELRQLVHPYGVIPLKVGARRVEARVVSAVWSFFAVYIMCFVVIMLMLMATGLDQVTAFSATVATLANLGPGLGEVSAHFGGVSDTAKWILNLSMLLGRLEIFTLLVIFTPAFWRR